MAAAAALACTAVLAGWVAPALDPVNALPAGVTDLGYKVYRATTGGRQHGCRARPVHRRPGQERHCQHRCNHAHGLCRPGQPHRLMNCAAMPSSPTTGVWWTTRPTAALAPCTAPTSTWRRQHLGEGLVPGIEYVGVLDDGLAANA